MPAGDGTAVIVANWDSAVRVARNVADRAIASIARLRTSGTVGLRHLVEHVRRKDAVNGIRQQLTRNLPTVDEMETRINVQLARAEFGR